LFQVKGMSFSVGSRISLIMRSWNTIQWSLSMEARAICQAASVSKLGKKRTSLLTLTAQPEVCRSSEYSTRTQFLFHLQPSTAYWLLLHTAHTLTSTNSTFRPFSLSTANIFPEHSRTESISDWDKVYFPWSRNWICIFYVWLTVGGLASHRPHYTLALLMMGYKWARNM
jgi:hypothetical protein